MPLLMRWIQGARHRSAAICSEQSNDPACQVAVEIKEWSEFRIRLTLAFLVPAGAGVTLIGRLATIATVPQACIPNKGPFRIGR
jgi:hypothetical protein